jgi:protein-tyrosine phosphatase
MMDWIDEWIAVGSLLDSENVDELKEDNIDIIIDARVLFDRHGLGYTPIIQKVLKVGEVLTSISNMKVKVLIHCLWGIDRTPFIAMVYVARKYNKKSTDAYAYIKEKHPGTVYHWDWIKMLK